MEKSEFWNKSTEISTGNNGTHSLSMSLDYYGPVETGLFGTWLILIIVCSIIGNVFVMLVIALDKDMRRADNGTNLFLFGLALADVMTGFFMAPVSLYTLFQEQWHLGDFWCGVNSFLNTTFLLTSIHILMWISIHKWMSVKRLSECNNLPVSRLKCCIMIGVSWTWGIFFGLLTTVVLGKAEYKTKTTQCGPKYPVLTVKSVILSVGNLILNFIIPFIIILIMYLRIYYIMKKTARFRRQSTRRFSEVKQSSGEEAAVKTIRIVMACFVLCWLPYVCYINFVFFTPDRNKIPAFLNPLAYCFGFTNSVCNPIIYAFRFPDFRNGYLHILRKICCRKTTDKDTSKSIRNEKETEKYALTQSEHGENNQA